MIARHHIIAPHRIPRIAVVGDVIVDRTRIGSVSRFAPDTPIPVVEMDHEEWSMGGAGNVAREVAAAGAHVCLFSAIGQQDSLKVSGKNFDACFIPEFGRKTTVKERIVAEHAGRRHVIARIDTETTQEINLPVATLLLQRLYDFNPEIVIVSDYGKGVCSEHLIKYLKIGYNQLYVDPPKSRDWAKYEGVTVLTPNRLEAGGMPAAELLKKYSTEAAIVKLDRDGCEVATRDLKKSRWIPHLQPIVAVNTCGAGDVFLANLAVARTRGMDWIQAARWANRKSGEFVTQA